MAVPREKKELVVKRPQLFVQVLLLLRVVYHVVKVPVAPLCRGLDRNKLPGLHGVQCPSYNLLRFFREFPADFSELRNMEQLGCAAAERAGHAVRAAVFKSVFVGIVSVRGRDVFDDGVKIIVGKFDFVPENLPAVRVSVRHDGCVDVAVENAHIEKVDSEEGSYSELSQWLVPPSFLEGGTSPGLKHQVAIVHLFIKLKLRPVELKFNLLPVFAFDVVKIVQTPPS